MDLGSCFNPETVSRSPKAVMNYTNYDTQVIQKYQCKVVGWTFNKFISPFDIHTVDDLRTLRDALRCGACFWVRMTKAEVSKHTAEMVLREKAGGVIGRRGSRDQTKGLRRGQGQGRVLTTLRILVTTVTMERKQVRRRRRRRRLRNLSQPQKGRSSRPRSKQARRRKPHRRERVGPQSLNSQEVNRLSQILMTNRVMVR